MKFITIATLLALVASVVGLVVKRQETDNITPSSLFFGLASWYHVGHGTCNTTNVDEDAVVAVASEQFAQGERCNRWIRLTNIETRTTAYGILLDTCNHCGREDLDLSPNLFKAIAERGLSEGTLKHVVWTVQPAGWSPANRTNIVLTDEGIWVNEY